VSIRQKERERGLLYVENIKVPEHRARGLDEPTVTRLAESLSRIGLQTPITVWQDDEWPTLVAGLHRLKAAERLGWQKVEVIYIEGDERDARMWEISENLHRVDLSAIERAEHIAEWLRLIESSSEPTGETSQPVANQPGQGVSGQVVPKLSARGRAGEGRPEGGIAAASRELGIGRKTALRAVRIAGLPDEIRDQAREERWSQDRLLSIARDQNAVEARRRNREADRLIAEQRLADAVQWLANRLNASELHQLGEMLSGVAPQLSRALMREAA
jgi:hypothetical protein